MEGTSQKRTRKGKSVAAKNDDATSSVENTLDPSTYLTYDVLRIVFQYLSARDLSNAAVVCRSWLEAANDEKCTRGPCCFFQCYRKQNDSDLLSSIENIRIKPSVGFFFIPEYTPRIIEVCIWKLLPEDCETVMLYSNGIIVENNEMEKHPHSNIVCAFLPQIPNVKIKSFKIVRKAIERSAEYEEIMSIIADQETAWSRGEASTCFMLFCNDLGHNLAKHWASVVKQRSNSISSVWGGVLQDIYAYRCTYKKIYSKRNDRPKCIAVLITGPIQTWSTVVDKKFNTKELVRTKLEQFKKTVRLKKHSVGFMFVCKARGTVMHKGETNVESTIFKKLFPKVPLVGCFGYGEFGKLSPMYEFSTDDSWYNEFSTVFMILTYG